MMHPDKRQFIVLFVVLALISGGLLAWRFGFVPEIGRFFAAEPDTLPFLEEPAASELLAVCLGDTNPRIVLAWAKNPPQDAPGPLNPPNTAVINKTKLGGTSVQLNPPAVDHGTYWTWEDTDVEPDAQYTYRAKYGPTAGTGTVTVPTSVASCGSGEPSATPLPEFRECGSWVGDLLPQNGEPLSTSAQAVSRCMDDAILARECAPAQAFSSDETGTLSYWATAEGKDCITTLVNPDGNGSACRWTPEQLAAIRDVVAQESAVEEMFAFPAFVLMNGLSVNKDFTCTADNGFACPVCEPFSVEPTPTETPGAGVRLYPDATEVRIPIAPGEPFTVPILLDTGGLDVTAVKLELRQSGPGDVVAITPSTDDFPESLALPEAYQWGGSVTVGSGQAGGKRGSALVVAYVTLQAAPDARDDSLILMVIDLSEVTAVGHEYNVLADWGAASFLVASSGVLAGDADGDGDVDIFDYNLVVSNFGGGPTGDTDGDGDVDIFDYNAVVSNFGT